MSINVNLSSKKILIISPESWGQNHVSKHHYAIELSKNNKVFFLNPPSSFFEIKSIFSTLLIVDYKPLFKGLRFIPSFLSALMIKIEVLLLEKKLNTKFDIIWNFDSSRFFNLSFLPDRLRIIHIVDYIENFQLGPLSKTCDIGFCTSKFILEKMQNFNDTVFNIGHGVSLKRIDDEIKRFENDKEFINRVAYVGNLSIKYIDWEIIYELVKENPLVAFYFIGPEGESNLGNTSNVDEYLFEIKTFPNAFFTGSINADEIIPKLKGIDILLLIYRSHEYFEQLANPHKVLEYLATGKTILASWTEEYKNHPTLLEMTDSNEEIPLKFNEIIRNLDDYNSPEKQAERIVFAKAHTYKKKIQQIEQLIQRHVKK